MVPSPPLAAVVLPITLGVPPLHIVSPVELIVPVVYVLRTVINILALLAEPQEEPEVATRL